jgi:hypothetical protein
MATLDVRHGGDEIVAKTTALFITSEDLEANTSTGYDADNYPASPAVTYYFSLEKSGQDALVSQVFTPSADEGKGEWNDLIVPASGTWTLHVRKTEDDSSVVSDSVVVV